MTIKPHEGTRGIEQGQALMTAGGLLGAIAASSCCILPLVLVSVGVSGPWIGHLTRLAPYQPYFIIAAIACLAGGYWLASRPTRLACADDAACARPLPSLFVRAGLIVATGLVLAALGFDIIAPLLFDS